MVKIMKKFIFLLVSLFSLILLISCDDGNVEDNSNDIEDKETENSNDSTYDDGIDWGPLH